MKKDCQERERRESETEGGLLLVYKKEMNKLNWREGGNRESREGGCQSLLGFLYESLGDQDLHQQQNSIVSSLHHQHSQQCDCF
jgi:hypothetical protein